MTQLIDREPASTDPSEGGNRHDPRLVDRVTAIGAMPGDTPDEALRKRILVLSASVITALSFVWVATYAWLGLYLAALIPFTYQVVSIINLAVFAKTKRIGCFVPPNSVSASSCRWHCS